MKYLLTALAVWCAAAWGTAARAEDAPDLAVAAVKAAGQNSVSQCFKVHRLLKTDSTHYWADWTNTCPYTIDAVYVMVGFRDQGRNEMGSGVWPMYFVEPGVHRVTRFSAPVADFETVHVHRITTDSALALKADPGPAAPGAVIAKDDPVPGKPAPSDPSPNDPSPNAVGDNSVGKIGPAPPSKTAAQAAASRAKPGPSRAPARAAVASSKPKAPAAHTQVARVHKSSSHTKY